MYQRRKRKNATTEIIVNRLNWSSSLNKVVILNKKGISNKRKNVTTDNNIHLLKQIDNLFEKASTNSDENNFILNMKLLCFLDEFKIGNIALTIISFTYSSV